MSTFAPVVHTSDAEQRAADNQYDAIRVCLGMEPMYRPRGEQAQLSSVRLHWRYVVGREDELRVRVCALRWGRADVAWRWASDAETPRDAWLALAVARIIKPRVYNDRDAYRAFLMLGRTLDPYQEPDTWPFPYGMNV